jgi:hypothetical protein
MLAVIAMIKSNFIYCQPQRIDFHLPKKTSFTLTR